MGEEGEEGEGEEGVATTGPSTLTLVDLAGSEWARDQSSHTRDRIEETKVRGRRRRGESLVNEGGIETISKCSENNCNCITVY